MLCGAVLLLSPDINRVINAIGSAADMDAAQQAVGLASESGSEDAGARDVDAEDAGAQDEGADTTSADDSESSDDVQLDMSKAGSSRSWLEEYNEKVRKGTGPAVNDPFTFDASDQSFAETGLVDAPVGVLKVEAMGTEVPVFLGSTEENMLRGAAVVAGTSAPLGEASSNCAIAAHRNMSFREIENVGVGDRVELRTIWGSYVYQVAEIRIIYPSETDAVSVQEGRDLLTLLTCYPYGGNTQRILAICERVPGAQPGNGGGAGDAQSVAGDVIGVDAIANVARIATTGAGFDELFLEDLGRILGRLLLAFVALRLIAVLVCRLTGR